MKIRDILIGKLDVKRKEKTNAAFKSIDTEEEIVIKVISDSGAIGYGSASPTASITGDIGVSIAAVINSIKSKIVGLDVDNMEIIMDKIDGCILRNYSAKAAIDMAIYDLFCKEYSIPLYKLLGGYRNVLTTDITINLNTTEDMIGESLEAIRLGYDNLKIKVGKGSKEDIEIVKAIRKAVRRDIKIRVDANQGWTPKQAIHIIRKFEDLDLNIEFVEQPVNAYDIEGLKYVTDNVETDILADESVFGPQEAFRIIQNRAADLINIKLMKCGGIHNAIKICNIAEAMDIQCMMGCMVESKIGITAAASFAGAKKNVTKTDLDTMILFEQDVVKGGVQFDENKIILSEKPGLGIDEVTNWDEIK